MPAPLPLTDLLAVDRTRLANERTLLAYLRTALGLIVLGISFLHFLEAGWYHVAGYSFFGFGAVILAIGVYRFAQVHRHLSHLRVHGNLETISAAAPPGRNDG